MLIAAAILALAPAAVQLETPAAPATPSIAEVIQDLARGRAPVTREAPASPNAPSLAEVIQNLAENRAVDPQRAPATPASPEAPSLAEVIEDLRRSGALVTRRCGGGMQYAAGAGPAADFRPGAEPITSRDLLYRHGENPGLALYHPMLRLDADGCMSAVPIRYIEPPLPSGPRVGGAVGGQ